MNDNQLTAAGQEGTKMSRYNAMKSWAKHLIEGQAEIDALNKDYWQQDSAERIRRDVAKGGAIAGRSFAAGALSVLIDLHLEDTEDRMLVPFDDRLTESDVLEAIKLGQAGKGAYWEYITSGGALSFAVWQRSEVERAALYAQPEDDMTDAEWAELRRLDLVLGY